jgi:hypothetical protein
MATIISTTHTAGSAVYAYPKSEATFANYSTRRVEADESAGLYSAEVDDATYGPIWFFFAGAGTPTSWDEHIAVIDVRTIDGSAQVLPGYITQQKAQQLNELIVPVGSKALQSLTCYNTDGSIQVLTGKTLQFVVSEPTDDPAYPTGQIVIDTIENASITVGGDDNNVATFRYTDSMVESPRVLIWSLRDDPAGNNVELQGGTFNVRLAATNDV